MPKERDYASSPVSDSLNLDEVIRGLAGDLQALRESKISTQDAHARAQLAKQLFNGARIYLQAAKTMQGLAKDVTQDALPTPTEGGPTE